MRTIPARPVTLTLSPALVGLLRGLVRRELKRVNQSEERMREKFRADFDPTATNLLPRLALLRQLQAMLGDDDA